MYEMWVRWQYRLGQWFVCRAKFLRDLHGVFIACGCDVSARCRRLPHCWWRAELLDTGTHTHSFLAAVCRDRRALANLWRARSRPASFAVTVLRDVLLSLRLEQAQLDFSFRVAVF